MRLGPQSSVDLVASGLFLTQQMVAAVIAPREAGRGEVLYPQIYRAQPLGLAFCDAARGLL